MSTLALIALFDEVLGIAVQLPSLVADAVTAWSSVKTVITENRDPTPDEWRLVSSLRRKLHDEIQATANAPAAPPPSGHDGGR